MIIKNLTPLPCDVVSEGVSGVVTCDTVPFALYINGDFNGVYNENKVDVVLPSDGKPTVSCLYAPNFVPENVDEYDDGCRISYALELSQYVPGYEIYIDGIFTSAVSKDGTVDLWIADCVHVYGAIDDIITYAYLADTGSQTVTIDGETYTSTNRLFTAPTGLVFEVAKIPSSDISCVLYDSASAKGETDGLAYGEHTLAFKDLYYGQTIASTRVFVPRDTCDVTSTVTETFSGSAHIIKITPTLWETAFTRYNIFTNFDCNKRSFLTSCHARPSATLNAGAPYTFEVPPEVSGTLVYKVQPVRSDGYTNSAIFATEWGCKSRVTSGLGDVYISGVEISPSFDLIVRGSYEPKEDGGDTASIAVCILSEEGVGEVSRETISVDELIAGGSVSFSLPELYQVAATVSLRSKLVVYGTDDSSHSDSNSVSLTVTIPPTPSTVEVSTRRA